MNKERLCIQFLSDNKRMVKSNDGTQEVCLYLANEDAIRILGRQGDIDDITQIILKRGLTLWGFGVLCFEFCSSDSPEFIL